MKIIMLFLTLALPLQTGYQVPAGTTDGWSFDTGNSLLTQCRGTLDVQVMGCLRYITGVMDAIGHEENVLMPDHKPAWRFNFICMPIHATTDQVRDLVVRYLESHPETRASSAASLIVVALEENWACPHKKNNSER